MKALSDDDDDVPLWLSLWPEMTRRHFGPFVRRVVGGSESGNDTRTSKEEK